jgi:hypothetical protein
LIIDHVEARISVCHVEARISACLKLELFGCNPRIGIKRYKLKKKVWRKL